MTEFEIGFIIGTAGTVCAYLIAGLIKKILEEDK